MTALKGKVPDDHVGRAESAVVILQSEPGAELKGLLRSAGLSYLLLHGLHPDWSVLPVSPSLTPYCEPIPASVGAPIHVIWSCSDPDLTPQNVLRHLASGHELLAAMGRSVKRILENKVVKYGMVRAIEAFIMEYVRTRTGINIPRVHLVFQQAGCTYIVMDYVRGRTLKDLWPSFDENERRARGSQVADIIAQLRALPPDDRPGPPDRGAESGPSVELRCEGKWFSDYGAGPFSSHQELAAWLNKMLSSSRGSKAHGPIFESSNPLVFTHQDLAARNVILDDAGCIWVIDWELAGWYPEYFEYACIAADTTVPRGWTDAVLAHIQPYEKEYRMLQSLRWVLSGSSSRERRKRA
ncbi:kinase-like domain-containing protein [Phlebopus sp. FC_14]|nr:kinase-like domain-containing protein [Phlebopus sp. FC_14]